VGLELITFVAIGTDCVDSCKSNDYDSPPLGMEHKMRMQRYLFKMWQDLNSHVFRLATICEKVIKGNNYLKITPAYL
jgi:hypothetical protein